MILCSGQGILRADAGYSFGFTVAQKNTGATKRESEYETIKSGKWSYFITMENKSFKDVSDMEIKYVMFSKQEVYGEMETVGGHQDLQRHEGSISIKLLKNNDQVSFSTDGIVLKNVTYNDGWYADEGAKGALRGLWLRVYVGGIMVAEYMNPQNLNDKVTFDPPPKDQQ